MWHIFHSNGQGRTQRRVSGALKPPFSRKINENYEQNPYKKLSRKEQIIKCKHEKTEVGAIFRSWLFAEFFLLMFDTDAYAFLMSV